MEQGKIDRINELARKSRVSKLSDDEILEQNKLRKEYIEAIKANFIKSIENIRIVDENGNTKAIDKKK